MPQDLNTFCIKEDFFFSGRQKQHLPGSPSPTCLESAGRDAIWWQHPIKASQTDICSPLTCHGCPCFPLHVPGAVGEEISTRSCCWCPFAGAGRFRISPLPAPAPSLPPPESTGSRGRVFRNSRSSCEPRGWCWSRSKSKA